MFKKVTECLSEFFASRQQKDALRLVELQKMHINARQRLQDRTMTPSRRRAIEQEISLIVRERAHLGLKLGRAQPIADAY